MSTDHVLLIGPPASGKIDWARKQSKLLTQLSMECGPDYDYIYRAAGLVDRDHAPPCELNPPFRAPHCTVSRAAMEGTIRRGYQWRPGEFSLAHGGILLLDEVREFSKQALEALRPVLREGYGQLAGSHAKYPAKFRLIATAQPCPCGWYQKNTKRTRTCECTEAQKAAYLGRIPGWLREQCRVVHFPYSEKP